MERVAIYLRKSRSEYDNELETLDKHRRTLLKFAKEKSLNIVRIYEEVVSGERIATRPEMMRLLNDVENSLYEAVLVMDMDRLGRGNMKEQGLIIETFRESETLIITPRKTYDLRNEMDEEYSEFEAFFARKELKIITRRLQTGRQRVAADGNFIATYPPFGYDVKRVDKNTRMLIPNPVEAPIVQYIFDCYVNKHLGMHRLADHLNELGLRFKGNKPFREWNVNQILKNRHYIGLIVFNKRASKPHPDPTRKRKSTKRSPEDVIVVKGKHEAIIDEHVFKKVEQMMSEKTNPSTHKQKALQNPLAGILRCKYCQKTMTRNCMSRNKVFVRCNTKDCLNGSTRMERVEREIIQALEELMERHKVKVKPKSKEPDKMDEQVLDVVLREWNELKRQKDNLHDLLERGVYSIEMYLERSTHLAERIKEKETAIGILRTSIDKKQREQKTRREFIPALINVIKLYNKVQDVEQKNRLLKSILHKVEFVKEKGDLGGNFEIALFPKFTD